MVSRDLCGTSVLSSKWTVDEYAEQTRTLENSKGQSSPQIHLKPYTYPGDFRKGGETLGKETCNLPVSRSIRQGGKGESSGKARRGRKGPGAGCGSCAPLPIFTFHFSPSLLFPLSFPTFLNLECS